MTNSDNDEISLPPGENQNPDVNIFWTGGQDSSCRMVQLSRYPVVIQPIYLRDNRRSEQHELHAIEAVTEDIFNHPETKCTILPLLTYNVSDIPPDRKITEAYKRLLKFAPLGSQYDWLARFAKNFDGIEICFAKGLANKTYELLMNKGGLTKVTKGYISYARLDKEKSDPDLYSIFGSFHFPLPLLEILKSEEIEEFRKLGFGDTVHKTWFCHKPAHDEPCGICNPCKEMIHKGLSFRLPAKALKRYETEMKYGNYELFKIWKKIRLKSVGY